MHALPLYETENIDRLVWPNAVQAISLQSPALAVVTDFRCNMPLVVDCRTPALEVERMMKHSHVKMKIVLDREGQLAGILSFSDMTEQHIVQKVSQGIPREELCAADFMRPKKALRSFDYADLEKSTVGDVVETLKDNGQRHCLVIDRQCHEIRGVISVSDIARSLRLPVEIQLQPSFAELSKVLVA